MDVIDLQVWWPFILTLGFFVGLSFMPIWHDDHPIARTVRLCAAGVAAVLALRYMSWRVFALPSGQSGIQAVWTVLFLGTELLNTLSNLLSLLFMSRTLNRSAQADAVADSPLTSAPTDVFIPTYNEPREVLERTIFGALDLDHPDLRVWVLDDGNRPWVRELATGLGANYLFRVKGKHAKAGNINEALRHVLSHGRRPQFLLVLDADFVACRHFLRRTLGLFEETDIGIVQTPQHFFNPDPVQANLACGDVWPDEQRFFFNVLMPCKDAWGAAFCCGTSAVIRVDALVQVGGMATETVTEDMLTSFKMREYGWRTIYLNERLSLGLAPEGLSEYIMQRGRWCLGGVQQLHTRWSPFGAGRIGLINRISCFDSALYWIISFPFKMMMLVSPAIYWLTGTSVISATTDDIVYWLLPSVAASICFMSYYGRNLIIPVMTDVTQLLSAVVVMVNVTLGLVRPNGRPFKVTDKGVAREKMVVRWQFMWPFAAIATANLLGLALNASPDTALTSHEGYSLNVFWSIFDAIVAILVCLACVELPKRRVDERFATNERGVVVWPGRAGAECRVLDISLGGARLMSDRWVAAGKAGTLHLDDDRLRVPFRVLRHNEQHLSVRFEPETAVRRALVARLFGGDYAQELQEVLVHRVLGTLMKRLLG